MTVLTASLAFLVPWLLGVVWLRGDANIGRPGTVPMVLGYGLLAGLLVTAVLLLLWGMAGWPMGFWPLLAVLVVLTLIGGFVGRRWRWSSAASVSLVGGWHWAVLLLLVLLLARWVGLLAEVGWRPMYPWDAWVNWAPRAKLWTGLGQITPVLSPDAWLAAKDPDVYTLPKHHYPATVPALQLWMSLALGRWDPALANLTWLAVPVGLGLATYGQLRRWGSSASLALIGCYLLLSMPMVNVHTALAGYADLWLSACYGLAAMAFFMWARDRNAADFGLFVILALLCVVLKVPGIVWAMIFLPALMVVRWSWKPVAALLAAGVILCAVLVVIGIDVAIPGLGQFTLTTKQLTVGSLVNVRVKLEPNQGIFLKNMFLMPQWHLFWYLFVVALLAPLVRRDSQPLIAVRVTLVLCCLAFLASMFFLTKLARSSVDYTTINRALLHVVPMMLFVAMTFIVPTKKTLWR